MAPRPTGRRARARAPRLTRPPPRAAAPPPPRQYEMGQGVTPSSRSATMWYRRAAAAAGSADANSREAAEMARAALAAMEGTRPA